MVSDGEPMLKTPHTKIKFKFTSSSSALSASSSVPVEQGTKYKTMADQLAKVAEHERVNHINIMDINAQAKLNVQSNMRRFITNQSLSLKRLTYDIPGGSGGTSTQTYDDG